MLFLTAPLVLVAGLGAGAAEKPLSVSYEQVLTTAKGSFVTKVWIKGDKKRVETADGREIDIVQGNTYVQIFPEQGFARRMPLAAAPSAPMPAAANKVSADGKTTTAAGTKPKNTDMVADLPCKLYELKSGEGVTRIWISDRLPFPLKWEEVDPGAGKFSYEVKNLKFADDIPEEYFQVPSGFKIVNAEPDDLPPELKNP